MSVADLEREWRETGDEAARRRLERERARREGAGYFLEVFEGGYSPPHDIPIVGEPRVHAAVSRQNIGYLVDGTMIVGPLDPARVVVEFALTAPLLLDGERMTIYRAGLPVASWPSRFVVRSEREQLEGGAHLHRYRIDAIGGAKRFVGLGPVDPRDIYDDLVWWVVDE